MLLNTFNSASAGAACGREVQGAGRAHLLAETVQLLELLPVVKCITAYRIIGGLRIQPAAPVGRTWCFQLARIARAEMMDAWQPVALSFQGAGVVPALQQVEAGPASKLAACRCSELTPSVACSIVKQFIPRAECLSVASSKHSVVASMHSFPRTKAVLSCIAGARSLRRRQCVCTAKEAAVCRGRQGPMSERKLCSNLLSQKSN